ncbi:hypothetical protein LWP59_18710 [Amycolatopsis acidiphila]|nr:hypothetical protein [Amycolatopsis acidiphila]UIJ63512.1 hypothetical protein LWP59_18710 [Amycolatopsis acidiphila]
MSIETRAQARKAKGWRPLFFIAFAPLLLVLAAGRFLRDAARRRSCSG